MIISSIIGLGGRGVVFLDKIDFFLVNVFIFFLNFIVEILICYKVAVIFL